MLTPLTPVLILSCRLRPALRSWVCVASAVRTTLASSPCNAYTPTLRTVFVAQVHKNWNILLRDATLARYMLSSCVCPSVRHVSRYCIKTTGGIELDFDKEASFYQSTPEIWVSPKIKGTSLWDFDTNSGPRKFRCGKSIALSTNSSSSTVELVDDTCTTVDESWLFTTCRSTVTL